jgi:CHAT domain-containing protein
MELIEMEERTRRRTELYQRLADLPQELERERLERERTAPDFRVRGAPFPSHFASQQDLMREAAMTVDSNPIVYHVTKEAWEQMKESVSPPASSFWDRLGEDL